jgi:DNA-binding Lrp family transcriptional regulator
MNVEPSISTLRLALRLANGFVLSLLGIYRGDRDFADALIIAALVQCNSASVGADPELQRRFAYFDTPVPEPMRRAISINAIASSLGLPFETVRRRIKRLVADGFCETTSQGVRIADRAMSSEAHRQALGAAYEAVQTLYFRLRRANSLPLLELPPYAAAFPGDEPPLRIVWRSSADYFLRMVEIVLPRMASVTWAMIVLEVTRANTQGLSDALRGEDAPGAEALVPDSYRRPVRTSEIAAQLGLPHETARRNLLELVEDGRVQRERDGFIVPAAVLAREPVFAASMANFRNLGRMFAELAETGVLSRWDAERDREAAAS